MYLKTLKRGGEGESVEERGREKSGEIIRERWREKARQIDKQRWRRGCVYVRGGWQRKSKLKTTTKQKTKKPETKQTMQWDAERFWNVEEMKGGRKR